LLLFVRCCWYIAGGTFLLLLLLLVRCCCCCYCVIIVVVIIIVVVLYSPPLFEIALDIHQSGNIDKTAVRHIIIIITTARQRTIVMAMA